MADNRAEIAVDGNAAGWRRTMQQVVQDARDGTARIESSFGGLGKVFEGVQGKIAAIGAVIGGGAVFKEAVAVSAQWTQQSVDLAAAIGISATAAGDLKAALADEGVEVQQFVAAGQKLSATLQTNEASLNKVGLRTRDATGALRPLNDLTVEAIELIGQYRAGTDRALAAQILFGRGFEINGDLAKINSELIAANATRQRELSAVVGVESVQSFAEYEAAGKSVSALLRALQQTIGNALMPVLADLGNWFSNIGPLAVTVVKGAIGGLAAAFHGLTTGVVVVWETVNAFVYSVAEPLIGVSNAISLAMTGDFSAARDRLSGVFTNIAGAWSGAMDRITDKAQQTRERLWGLFGTATEDTAPPQQGRSASGLVNPEKIDAAKSAKVAEQSMMGYYEAALAAEKRLAAEKDALRAYTQSQELAYWQNLLQHANLSARDRLAIERKVSDLVVAVRRDEARQAQALTSESARSAEVLALGRIDLERVAAQTSFDLGQITKEQLLQQEMQFEQRRLEIQRTALQERLKLLEADPNTNALEMARIKNQLLELEQRSQLRVAQLRGQQAGEKSIFGDIGNSFSQSLQGMLTGAQTWSQSVMQVFAGVRDVFIRTLVTEPLQQWIAGQARMLAVKMGFIAQEKSIDAASAAATVGIKAGETAAVVAANAAQAGSGAAASQAAVPIVGPGLALAAMAAVFAAVMGMGGKTKSAAGGYDIPRGINPLTQLHEEEMVLPKGIANPLRALISGADQQGMERGGGGGTVNYNDYSGRLTRGQIRENARTIAEELNRIHRDGWTPK